MKYAVLLLLLSLTAAAQQPRIDSLRIDETKGELAVHGSFGLLQGTVFCDSVPLTIRSWDHDRIVAAIPDTGKGSAGSVRVEVPGYPGVERLLTMWCLDHGQVSMQRTSRTETGTYKKDILVFRADLHSMILTNKWTSITTELVKGSLHQEGRYTSASRNTNGGYDAFSEKAILPVVSNAIADDSSFHARLTLDFSTRTGRCDLFDIRGVSVHETHTWADSAGYHYRYVDSATDGDSYSIFFSFDSAFHIMPQKIWEADIHFLDTLNIRERAVYALPVLTKSGLVYERTKPMFTLTMGANGLQYTLDIANHVVLEVYDLLGRLISMSNYGYQVAGRYAVAAHTLPHVYIARLRAGNESRSLLCRF